MEFVCSRWILNWFSMIWRKLYIYLGRFFPQQQSHINSEKYSVISHTYKLELFNLQITHLKDQRWCKLLTEFRKKIGCLLCILYGLFTKRNANMIYIENNTSKSHISLRRCRSIIITVMSSKLPLLTARFASSFASSCEFPRMFNLHLVYRWNLLRLGWQDLIYYFPDFVS